MRGVDIAEPAIVIAISRAIDFVFAGASLVLALATVFPCSKLLHFHIGTLALTVVISRDGDQEACRHS